MGAKIAYRCEKKSLIFVTILQSGLMGANTANRLKTKTLILQSGLMGANTANRLKTKTLILQGRLMGAQAADRLRARRQ
jgi:hypothetical protein